MDFGVVLQTNPPASRTVQLAELAEAHGFSHVWTFDSHLLWQEPYVIYSRDPRRDASGSSSARWSPTRRPGTGR